MNRFLALFVLFGTPCEAAWSLNLSSDTTHQLPESHLSEQSQEPNLSQFFDRYPSNCLVSPRPRSSNIEPLTKEKQDGVPVGAGEPKP